MSKVYIFLVVIMTVIVGLSAVGLINGATYQLLSSTGILNTGTTYNYTNYTIYETNQGGGFTLSDIFNSLLGVAGIITLGLAITGLVAGLYTQNNAVSAIRMSLAFGIGGWITIDFWALYQNLGSIIGTELVGFSVVIRMLLIILWFGFIYSIGVFATGGDD